MNYLDTINYDPETGIFRWSVARPGCSIGSIAGSKTATGYVVIKAGRKQIRAHRLAWYKTNGEWPDGEIDHINGNRSDNRICNLRVVDRSSNSQNRRSAHRDSSHGFLGASWNRQHQRWQAKIVARNVRHHLGYFDSAEAASEAYMQAKQRLHIEGA